MERAILLADMNSFFASVHQALDPRLRGQPVVVIGDPEQRRGIVLSASYEAKRRGVKTGMILREARQVCPHGYFIKSQYHLYVSFSSRFLRIMRDFTPLVEPFSIDEAFLDVTGSQKLFGTPVAIARQLKQRIRQEVGLTCSVGVAPNKLLAKMGADLQKPDGLTVIGRRDVPAVIWPLPVRDLFGVGPRYEQHLRRLNIFTIGDLARFPVDILKRKFGVIGEVLWLNANGTDSSPVEPESLDRVKSMGHQVTLPRDCKGDRLRAVILELADLVAYRVRSEGYVGRTVVLCLKDPDFCWLSRMRTIPEYTDLGAEIAAAALSLLAEHWFPDWPVRMVGVTLANLIPCRIEQPALFGERERLKRIEQACDLVRNRFGRKTICRAASLIEGGVEYAR
ncbi:MAG: DNA polymerase IV [Thermacetogeniaceae bacterium]|jgi:DNA polymerase-4